MASFSRRALVLLALLETSVGLRLGPPMGACNSAAQLAAQKLQTALLASAVAVLLSAAPPAPALAAGTVAKVDLKVKSYEEVTCPEALAQGRAGGALGAGAGGAGIAQKCVQVVAATTNDSGNVLEGAGVFGRIEGVKDGMSVLGNGQDGKNDAGQFAMIDKIPKGDSTVEVAADVEPLRCAQHLLRRVRVRACSSSSSHSSRPIASTRNTRAQKLASSFSKSVPSRALSR